MRQSWPGSNCQCHVGRRGMTRVVYFNSAELLSDRSGDVANSNRPLVGNCPRHAGQRPDVVGADKISAG